VEGFFFTRFRQLDDFHTGDCRSLAMRKKEVRPPLDENLSIAFRIEYILLTATNGSFNGKPKAAAFSVLLVRTASKRSRLRLAVKRKGAELKARHFQNAGLFGDREKCGW